VGITTSQSKILTDLNKGYYSTAFQGYQQKEISGFLTCMWQLDPFKAKWSILAKAYSLIRDSQGKDAAPLDQFLAITCPFIGIIMPGYYLHDMGWEITINKDGQTVMRRGDCFLDERLFLTNLSVNDLIRHCSNQGFFSGKISEVLSLDNEAVMAMASSVQSTIVFQTSLPNNPQMIDANSADDVETGDLSIEGPSMSTDDVTAQPAGECNPENNATEGTGGLTNLGEAHNLSSAPTVTEGTGATMIAPLSFAGSPSMDTPYSGHENLGSGTLPAITEVEEDVGQPRLTSDDLNPASSLSAANFQVASQYPFNAEFDPDASAFVFDPFIGSQFDAFEMSDIAWNELMDFN